MKSVITIVGLLILCVVSALGQDWTPGQLYAIFKPEAVDSLWQDSTGFTCCGIAYIDSLNRVNGCISFEKVSRAEIDLMANDYQAVFPDSADILSLASAYRADTNVKWAGPNFPSELCFTPDDPFFRPPSPTSTPSSYQWPLDSNHLQMQKAWDITKGSPSVVIAIIETGIAWRHPDLEPNVWINSAEDLNQNNKFDPVDSAFGGDLNNRDDDSDGYADNVVGYNFRCDPISPNPEPNGFCNEQDPLYIYYIHGARVCGNAAAATQNNKGVAGVAFNCRFMPMAHRLDITGPFNEALSFLVAMRNRYNVPDVVNMSFESGAVDSANLLNPTTTDLLDSLYSLGVILVAAAGNSNPIGNQERSRFPANHPRVMSVAGTDSNDYKFDRSNYHSTVDLSAPGFNYMTTHAFDEDQNIPVNYTYNSIEYLIQPYGWPIRGTSFASPQVAGVAALIRSVYPDFTVDEVWAKLKSSVDSIHYSSEDSARGVVGKMGTGRLNAFKALTFFGNIPSDTTDTTLSGTVYVSGDITVKAGKTLRLAAGTVFRFYPGDVMKKVPDTTKTAIVVDSGGTLIIEGTPGNPVRLVSFRREQAPYDSTTTNDWQGIVVRPKGRLSLNNTIIRHAYIGIEDSSKYSHTIQNVRVGRCKMYGILAVNTDSLTIRGCRADSINNSPAGVGFSVVSATSVGARVVSDTASACWYGIQINFSATPVESCWVEAAAGTLTSNTGIYNYDQGYLVGYPNLSVKATDINGYFTNELFHNSIKGRVQITDECSFLSSTGSRTPNGIRSTAGDYLKLRGSVVLDWGANGIITAHYGGKVTALGTYPTDKGNNAIYTSAAGSTWKYVYDVDCSSCSSPIIKAEWNQWNAWPPSSSRFSPNVDFNPYMPAGGPKVAADEGKEILPKPTDLFQNYPNPFNPTTLIQFNLEKAEKVNLDIFNILGQKVRTLLSGEGFSAGPYTFLWDGRDDRGGAVSSGMYIYRLQTPTYLKTKKMMLVK